MAMMVPKSPSVVGMPEMCVYSVTHVPIMYNWVQKTYKFPVTFTTTSGRSSILKNEAILKPQSVLESQGSALQLYNK